jgi:hypothetical protein
MNSRQVTEAAGHTREPHTFAARAWMGETRQPEGGKKGRPQTSSSYEAVAVKGRNGIKHLAGPGHPGLCNARGASGCECVSGQQRATCTSERHMHMEPRTGKGSEADHKTGHTPPRLTEERRPRIWPADTPSIGIAVGPRIPSPEVPPNRADIMAV